MSEQSLISTLEKQYQEKDIEHVMQELYTYISDNKNFNAVSAKALVHIIIHDSKNEELNRSLLSFVEIIFEDKLNNNKMRDAKYYIGKALKSDLKGKNSATEPAEPAEPEAEAKDVAEKEGEKSETTTKPEEAPIPSEASSEVAAEPAQEVEPEKAAEPEQKDEPAEPEKSDDNASPPSLG